MLNEDSEEPDPSVDDLANLDIKSNTKSQQLKPFKEIWSGDHKQRRKDSSDAKGSGQLHHQHA